MEIAKTSAKQAKVQRSGPHPSQSHSVPLLFFYYNLVRIAREGGAEEGEGRSPLGNFRRKMEIWDNWVAVEGLRVVVVKRSDGGKVKARLKYTARGMGEEGWLLKEGWELKRKLYSGQCSPRAVRFNYFCSASTTLPGNLPSAFPCPSHSLSSPLPVSRCGRGGRRF